MRKIALACLGIVLILAACNKEKEDLGSAPLSTYYPLKVGKSITYRLDSIVPAPFGLSLVTHSYRAKDSVDAEITDNTGRKAYRIFRYITDTGATQPYRSIATFMAVPSGTDWIEYVDNNQRFMKLRFPVLNDFEWKGNTFFTDPNSYFYGWNYRYDSVNMSRTILGKTYDSTIKVFQQDDITYPGPPVDSAYQQKDYSIERYARGIGLVEKDFLHYIWQPRTTTRAAYFDDASYGLRLRIIDHN